VSLRVFKMSLLTDAVNPRVYHVWAFRHTIGGVKLCTV
jgi:hypothetical protein